MSVPKKRRSKSKVRSGRNHKRATAILLINCPNCKEKKAPHRACVNCGQQKGKAVIDLTKRTDRATRRKKKGN